MIRTQRLVSRFQTLVSIDNPTLHECALSDALQHLYADLGITLHEDDAALIADIDAHGFERFEQAATPEADA